MPLPRPSRSWRRAFPSSGAVAPKAKVGHCVGCEPCRITTGFSGAGAFSDGKLSLSHEVGGDLPELIGEDVAQAAIKRVDDAYLSFGADEHVEGIDNPGEVKDIRRRAIQAGLKARRLPHSPPWEPKKAQEIYGRIEDHLRDAGVKLLFETECTDVLIEGDAATDSAACKGVRVRTRAGEFSILAEKNRGGDGPPRRRLARAPLQRARHRACAWPG